MSNDLQVKLATCCRMMEWLGLIDFNGHVSARLPGRDNILINSWGTSRSHLTPADITEVDMQGKTIDKGVRAPSELPLHTAIYRMRPDVQAVAHIHSPMVIILSVADKKIVPVISRGSIFPRSGVPVYHDSRLINTPERAEEVARIMGQGRAVILRAHGAVVSEGSIEGVFFASLCLEDNAKKLYASLQIGQPGELRSEEIEEYQSDYAKRPFSKAWSYYRNKAEINF